MNDAQTRITVNKETPGCWRVTLDHPPINTVDDRMYDEIYDLVERSEAEAAPRLAMSKTRSSAIIRGRARGGGSEFAMACDVRFASREKAIFGQPEVGFGLIPGGGALERLPLLVGRSRAIEVVLGADDFDADTAERYGWINRAIPEAELDGYVASFVRRVLSFDSQALSTAKAILNHTGLPNEVQLRSTQASFGATLRWPEALQRMAKSRERGLGVAGEFELNIGRHVADL